jgi:hypothetical protein
MGERAKFVIAVLALACLVTPAVAQQQADIRGTVTDEAGGLVEGASVTVIGADTGLTLETVTNAAGFYNIGGLPLGLYIVSVEKEGFSTAVITDIQLNVNDVRQVDVKLTVGEITDEITTAASAIVVETIGGEVAGLITGEQVRELPLNGRNFLQLTLLMPGVSAPEGFNTKNKGLLTGSDLSVSGGATTANLWTVDGAANNDVGSNRTILVYPSLEAIEEFKIHRNSYGAEFGGGGGAQVNLVTRGGTNDFSGSVFYFARRDGWNEANALLKEANQPKAPLDRDDYGFTFGGPIKKDRVHFFASAEWNDEIRGVAVSGHVPTAEQRAGDFNFVNTDCGFQVPVDPLTGQPFPGNVIPADRISPAGQALLRQFPDANLPNDCPNWVTAVSTPIDWEQINGRLDWTITTKHRALVRYTDDDWGNPGPTGGSSNGLWGDTNFPQVDSNWAQPSDSLVLQLNSVIGTSAINTLTFSQSGNEIDIGLADQDEGARQAIVDTYPTFYPREGKTNGGNSPPLGWGYGANLNQNIWTQGPWYNTQNTDLYKNDYEQVFGGDHVLKAGVSYSENNKLETPWNGSQETGTLGGWGAWPGFATGYVGNDWGGNSGNSIADLLLEDMVYGFSEASASIPVNINWEDLDVYVADSWKVAPNLTLDYGVRWSYYYQPYHEGEALYSSFNPDRWDPAFGNAACNGLMQQPGIDGCGEAGFPNGASFGPNEALINEDSDNFAPRLGLAWDIKGDGDSVLRAGFGQFFQRERVSPHLGLTGNPPGVRRASGLRTLDGRFFALSQTQGGNPALGIDIDRENGYLIQYNVSWEQALGRNSSIEVAYVASRGRRILDAENLNYVPSGDNNGNGINDRLEFVQCPGGGDGDACRQAFRVFGVYGNGDIAYWTNSGESEYDSIQTQYIARFGRGSQFQASYTWSDFTSNANVAGADGGLTAGTSVTDPENRDLDWADAGIHREHVFNASLIHNLPTYEGEGGFKEHLLGNWSVGGIVSYSSGTPVNITTGAFDGLPVAGGGAGYDNAQRPIRVPGVSCSGSGRQVLNPDAFTLTGYQLGEVSQMAPKWACEGADFFQIDLSLYKNIPMGDRLNAQLRVEIFNIFDEENWISVDGNWEGTTSYDDDTAPTVVTGSTPSDNFGVAAAARDAREIQLGLKLTF